MRGVWRARAQVIHASTQPYIYIYIYIHTCIHTPCNPRSPKPGLCPVMGCPHAGTAICDAWCPVGDDADVYHLPMVPLISLLERPLGKVQHCEVCRQVTINYNWKVKALALQEMCKVSQQS